jgi:Protein of unknown function (DUF1523)
MKGGLISNQRCCHYNLQIGVFNMAEKITRMRIMAILIVIVACILMVLYSYFIADTVQTRITDAQMTKVDGRFMIASEYRPFMNEDVWYRFKFDSGTVQNDAIRLRGKMVKIKKYGWRIPMFSMYENVLKITEIK